MNQQNKSDILEILIILAMVLLVIVIYVPVAIWEEESYYEEERAVIGCKICTMSNLFFLD